MKERIAELESVGEAVKEYSEKAPERVLSEKYRISEKETERFAARVSGLKSEEPPHHLQQTLELLQIVQSRGILNAVSIAKKINDPHLEDDFHDALVKYLQANAIPEAGLRG